MDDPKNPFRIGVLAEAEHFADREDEVARVEKVLREPGARLVLYGDRRLGKSSVLLTATRSVLESGGRAAMVSFATASSESEAAQRVLNAVRPVIGRGWRDWLFNVAQSLAVSLEITPGAAGEGSVRLRFDHTPGGAERHLLPDVLDVIQGRMAAQETTLGLGIDEFQRIHEWGGENAEWALREAIQRHDRIAYVFAGSSRGLIEAMVSRKGRALWKQADVLPLGPIESDLLARWIWSRAEETGAPMTRAAAERVVHLTYPRTRDVIQLARRAWPGPREGIGVAEVDAAFEQSVEEQAALFERIWRSLNPVDQNVLRVFAAAAPDEHVAIMSAQTLQSFKLGAKSTVMSAIERLMGQELLASDDGRYVYDDPYFRRWVQLHALADVGLSPPSLA